MALRRSNPSQFLMRQSNFITTNVMQWPFFAFQAPFWGILPIGSSKIVFEWSSPSILWAAKKFLWELLAPNMCSGTSSWSYLRAETNGVSFGCFNVMIWLQTWANGHFLDFIPSQRRLQGKFHWNRAKIVFWWSATLPLWAVKIFSTHY